MFKGMKPTKKIEHCNYNTKQIRGKIKKMLCNLYLH